MIEVSWVAVGGVCSLLVAAATVFGFWNKFADRITRCETTAQAATILSTALQLKTENLQRELSDYKTTAAGSFISDKELNTTEIRFSGLVDEIKRDIRGVNERLDRVLEQRSGEIAGH